MANVREFLHKYQMASIDIDPFKTLEKFNLEIKKGLERDDVVKNCSIPMIATYLNPDIMVEDNKKTYTIIKFIKGNTNGISNVEAETFGDGAFYNLRGQRVMTPSKGLYIMNGKKFFLK